MTDFTDSVYTLSELSEYLKVPVDAIQQEISKGNLRAANIGGHIRVRETDLYSFMASASASPSSPALVPDTSTLKPAPDFDFKWPKVTERFTDVLEGFVTHNKKPVHVKLGFTNRESSGRNRRRSLVIIDGYPTVEFVAADTRRTGSMASIIRDREAKQVMVGAPLPEEYLALPTGPYRSIVDGPGAANGVAVICDSNDTETMIKHALIRTRYRAERS